MTTTGKQAQKLQEQRINDRIENIQDCVSDLSYNSERIEDKFADIKEMIRTGKKKDIIGHTLSYHRDGIEQYISELENNIIKLKSLEKDNVNIPHYQQKHKKYLEALNDLDNQLEGSKSISIFSGIFSAPKEQKDVTPSTRIFSANKKTEETVFSSNDTEKLKANLINLSTAIDSKIESFLSDNKEIVPEISTFESGIAMLKSIAPNDSIIAHFEAKLKKWEDTIKRAKMRLRILIAVAAVIFIIFFIYQSLQETA